MDVTLPEGTDTTKPHKIFVVFTSTGNTANYIANVRDLKGIKTATAKAADSRAAAKESVDLTKGLTEGTEYNKDSAYATVSTLETAGVNVLSELSTPEQPVTIDGVKYTQFVQASTQLTQVERFLVRVQQHMYLRQRLTVQLHYITEQLQRYGGL